MSTNISASSSNNRNKRPSSIATTTSSTPKQTIDYSNKKPKIMTDPSVYVRNPEELFCNPNCKAYVLSISNQHVNLLLWTDVIENDMNGNSIIVDKKSSIVKITVVPCHKERLVSANYHTQKKITNLVDLNERTKDITQKDSKGILQFLSQLDCKLTSESGAEYSYYAAKEKGHNQWWQHNPIDIFCQTFGLFHTQPPVSLSYQIELISPASKQQIERSLPAPTLSLIEETPLIYEKVVEPFIQKIVDSGSLSWIGHIIQGKKEQERLLYNDDNYIINIDTKWRTHPDANKVPKEEWYQHPSIDDLYCLGITKDSSIRSLRDLRAEHIPMLQSMMTNGIQVIERIYGVPKDQIRIFIHYQPQFYHFHIHYTRIHNEIGCQVERGHLVLDVIQNLTLDSEYYKKRTITHKISTSSEIYFKLQQM